MDIAVLCYSDTLDLPSYPYPYRTRIGAVSVSDTSAGVSAYVVYPYSANTVTDTLLKWPDTAEYGWIRSAQIQNLHQCL